MRDICIFSLVIIICLIFFPSSSIEEVASARTCSYDVALWNVQAKRIIEVQKISHPYSAIIEEEIDHETGCTVCSEDQVIITLPSISDFRICRMIAAEVRDKLLGLIEAGVPILSIRGYQVVRSRGGIDDKGNRKMLSNHSFGTALDINRERNGLYDNCVMFGPECRLVLGGHWRPGVPGTLLKNGPVVRAMKELGFRWGGEIKGRQKDFMHFSLTGY